MKTKTAKVGGVMGKVGVLLTVLLAVASIAAPKSRAEDDKTIRVSVGEAVSFPAENVAKLAIADPTIADVTPLSDKELSIIGKKAGVTTLSVVREGSPSQLYRIEVGNDAAAATIREMIGQPGITVRSIGDTLVLDGQVDDELQAARAVQVASAYKDKVLNLLEVKKPRQVKIRMRVAEVNTSAAKNIGFKWFGPQGQVQYATSLMGPGLPGPSSVALASGLGAIDPAGGGPVGSFGSGIGADVILQMLITKNLAKLLSEPTLITLSGKEASFLVGKEVPIVQQLSTSFTVEFKEVGVRMKVKPVVDSQNQINTVIHAEVSQISADTVKGGGGVELPIITTKKADTTLQVKDGQTIVIGGLLENNLTADTLRKVPWLAEIPIFGFLFRHKSSARDQAEVLFFLTPEIIKDVDADTASAARTPALQEWNGKEANDNVLPVPSKRDNWGLHRPDGLGFAGEGLRDYDQPILGEPRPHRPKAEPKATAPVPSASKENVAPAPVHSEVIETPAAAPEPQPAPAPVVKAAPPAPVAKAAPAEPPKEPTTNFAPARPVVQ